MIQSANRMFPERIKSNDPRVIVRVENARAAISYDQETIQGKFFRVVPQTPREIAALRMLDHRVDKFAPADGNGAIVSASALAKLDA